MKQEAQPSPTYELIVYREVTAKMNFRVIENFTHWPQVYL